MYFLYVNSRAIGQGRGFSKEWLPRTAVLWCGAAVFARDFRRGVSLSLTYMIAKYDNKKQPISFLLTENVYFLLLCL